MTRIVPGKESVTDYGRRLLALWGPVAGWFAIVLIMSGDRFSGKETGRWLAVVLHSFFPDLDPASIGHINLLLRKMAHLFEYGVLGALSYRALWGGHPQWSRARGLAAGLALAIVCAGVDEGRQTYVPSRVGSPWDVLVDTVGAGIGLTASSVRRWVRDRSVASLPRP